MLIDGTPLERPAAPLDDLLRIGLEAALDEIALVSAERALTWRRLEAETARLAGGYRGLGLGPGDRLASLMPNRIDLVVHYLACFRARLQVIVHDGSNISPLEIEAALGEHPTIDLAGVVGIHDSVHGENVRAYVTLRDGAEQPSSADLIVFCRERVGYKAPEEIVFLAEMPLNPTGKIDRVGLKRMAEDHLHPHGL
jgi:acyl-CoA synthetase (AMP-forming)/AMP-acid ligase II